MPAQRYDSFNFPRVMYAGEKVVVGEDITIVGAIDLICLIPTLADLVPLMRIKDKGGNGSFYLQDGAIEQLYYPSPANSSSNQWVLEHSQEIRVFSYKDNRCKPWIENFTHPETKLLVSIEPIFFDSPLEYDQAAFVAAVQQSGKLAISATS